MGASSTDRSRCSVAVDLDHGVDERPRRFLRQVVPDAAGDGPMRIPAGRFGAPETEPGPSGVMAVVRMTNSLLAQ
jgi:hypothetical protein